MTVYQMKEQLGAIGNERRAVAGEVRTLAADPTSKMEDLKEKRARLSELEERYGILKGEIDTEEAEARSRIQAQTGTATGNMTDEQRNTAACADFIRGALLGRSISEETRNLLGAIPTPHASGGEKLLPTNLQNTLISEPMVKNPLRELAATSTIAGLELPKISYELDDDEFITDAQTAKEIKLTGDKVSFGRFKFKVIVRISDTVLHGTDTGLVEYVRNALNSGVAAKEKRVSLTLTPKIGEEHMSFYSEKNGISVISDDGMYDAILAALADLHEDYRENASILMVYKDYLGILKKISDGNRAFFTHPPEMILSKPTVFSDSAANPIVGDFRYARLNYDGPIIYDTDKNVEEGEYLFVLTAWFDFHILLKSAFRIAAVKTA